MWDIYIYIYREREREREREGETDVIDGVVPTVGVAWDGKK